MWKVYVSVHLGVIVEDSILKIWFNISQTVKNIKIQYSQHGETGSEHWHTPEWGDVVHRSWQHRVRLSLYRGYTPLGMHPEETLHEHDSWSNVHRNRTPLFLSIEGQAKGGCSINTGNEPTAALWINIGKCQKTMFSKPNRVWCYLYTFQKHEKQCNCL